MGEGTLAQDEGSTGSESVGTGTLGTGAGGAVTAGVASV